MKMDLMHDSTIDAMANYMTRLSKRQQVVVSNIANIDTPGYKAKDIPFHVTMNELLAEGSPSLQMRRPEQGTRGGWRFASVEPEIYEETNLLERTDGNNVNMDRELMKLTKTSFGYSLMAQLLRTKFRTIASSISEGRV